MLGGVWSSGRAAARTDFCEQGRDERWAGKATRIGELVQFPGPPSAPIWRYVSSENIQLGSNDGRSIVPTRSSPTAGGITWCCRMPAGDSDWGKRLNPSANSQFCVVFLHVFPFSTHSRPLPNEGLLQLKSNSRQGRPPAERDNCLPLVGLSRGCPFDNQTMAGTTQAPTGVD